MRKTLFIHNQNHHCIEPETQDLITVQMKKQNK